MIKGCLEGTLARIRLYRSSNSSVSNCTLSKQTTRNPDQKELRRLSEYDIISKEEGPW